MPGSTAPALLTTDGRTSSCKDALTRALERGETEPTGYARLYLLAAARAHRIEAAALATNLGALFALAHAGD